MRVDLSRWLSYPHFPGLKGTILDVKCYQHSFDGASFPHVAHLDAAEPVAYISEGVLRCDVVHQHHPVCLPEELLGDAVIPAGSAKHHQEGGREEGLPTTNLKSQWKSWECISTRKAKPDFYSYHSNCREFEHLFLSKLLPLLPLSDHTPYRVPPQGIPFAKQEHLCLLSCPGLLSPGTQHSASPFLPS